MISDPGTHDTLQQHALFAALSPGSFRDVLARAGMLRLERDSILFRQGEPVRHLYLLRNGQIKLHRLVSGSIEKIVSIHAGLHLLGADALLGPSRHHVATASALRDCDIIRVDAPHFSGMIAREPAAALQLATSLAGELHQRLDEIDSLLPSNASHRVARYLARETKAGSSGIRLSIPKRMVASQLGVTPETFSRILHRMRDDGLISIERRDIRIINPDHLLKYCE